jgi:TatD DNase family protein
VTIPARDQYGRPPAADPEPLPASAFDAHCHLDLVLGPVSDVLARAAAAGITRVVTVGTDLPSCYSAVTTAADYDEVFAAVAIHPNETTKAGHRAHVLDELAELAALPQARAVGETGLDYYWDDAPHDVQQDWFRAHIALAKQVGKPLMIHDRDAHEDILRILAEEGPPETVIFHCFSGDAGLAKRCVDAGYLLSFAGVLTFSSAAPLREAAAVTPPGQLLAETDAPFLTPVPNRGKSNSPAQVANTIRALAAIKEIDVAELCAILQATGQRVFGPW